MTDRPDTTGLPTPAQRQAANIAAGGDGCCQQDKDGGFDLSCWLEVPVHQRG